jgi:cytidine diphosphoramidate kinase
MNSPDAKPGTVFWITGLSGAGKTTLATALVPALRRAGRTALLLDGDKLREILGRTDGFEPAQRLALAQIYARLAAMVARQGIDAVCATISMFDAVRDWNRTNNAAYVEIYLDVPLELRRARDPKGIYARAAADSQASVPGFDAPFEAPKNPDLVFGTQAPPDPDDAVARILAWCAQRGYFSSSSTNGSQP